MDTRTHSPRARPSAPPPALGPAPGAGCQQPPTITSLLRARRVIRVRLCSSLWPGLEVQAAAAAGAKLRGGATRAGGLREAARPPAPGQVRGRPSPLDLAQCLPVSGRSETPSSSLLSAPAFSLRNRPGSCRGGGRHGSSWETRHRVPSRGGSPYAPSAVSTV